MKALTIIQPWATLAAIGAKHIETRSWPTSYRGPLALHAAKSFPWWAREPLTQKFFKEALFNAGYLNGKPLPLGCIVATCELIEVSGPISLSTSFSGCKEHWKNKHCFSLTDQERAFGDYSVNRYMWLLANVKPLPEPIPARGTQGLWEWSEE